VNRAVFLDRDGVINKAVVRDGKPYPPNSLAEMELVPGVVVALAKLKNAGFRLLVVTNQPDVARGTQKREVVESINNALLEKVPLDQVYTCFHDDSDNCSCRKPLPGLIWQGAEEWQVDPAKSFLVGDRWKDIASGLSAGCITIFIDWNYAEQLKVVPDYQVFSIEQAVELILEMASKEALENADISR
jgi:D-glycero-D-manno-heptose 1,7-bisphosphate phosphatase